MNIKIMIFLIVVSYFQGLAMKAVRVHTFGGPEVLKVESDVPIPVHSETQVFICTLASVDTTVLKLLCIGFDSGWFSWCESS